MSSIVIKLCNHITKVCIQNELFQEIVSENDVKATERASKWIWS